MIHIHAKEGSQSKEHAVRLNKEVSGKEEGVKLIILGKSSSNNAKDHLGEMLGAAVGEIDQGDKVFVFTDALPADIDDVCGYMDIQGNVTVTSEIDPLPKIPGKIVIVPLDQRMKEKSVVQKSIVQSSTGIRPTKGPGPVQCWGT